MHFNINTLVYSLYILRKKAKDSHKDSLSNAIFFMALFLTILLSSIFTIIVVVFKFEVSFSWFDSFFGMNGDKLLAGIVLFIIWVILKLRVSSKTDLDIQEQIKKSEILLKKPELIAFSPLILSVFLMVLILLL